MPIYQVVCKEHGAQEVVKKCPESVESAPCPVCGAAAQRDWSAPIGVKPFQSYWTEALSQEHNPVFIDSREKEKSLCKKFNFERVS